MDSMLNLAYKKLRLTINSEEQHLLRTEQLQWLKKRDKYFSALQQEFQRNYKKGEWGRDMFMVTYHNDAEFVRKRVVTLIKRIK